MPHFLQHTPFDFDLDAQEVGKAEGRKACFFVSCFRRRPEIRSLILLLSAVSGSLAAYRSHHNYLPPNFFRQILLLVPYGTVSVKQRKLFQIHDILPLLRISFCQNSHTSDNSAASLIDQHFHSRQRLACGYHVINY